MLKIEHIGIAVRNLETANKLFSILLNTEVYKEETVESEGVMTSFLKTGETKIELLQATGEQSPVSKFIEKKGEGIHHIAFEVENIKDAMKRLKESGFILLSEEPRVGADNKLVCFLHPKSTNGVLVEICQERK
ncbi:MAG: methylmalonyl-CoA epimerase [Bacteroidetes bacterium]|nr:methylmalonyl-CoA epimerase [Bacteroidota bacterium]